MKLVGLTGGIASGKSTVAQMLRELGAPVIDADQLAREVVEPGQPALSQIAARWPECIDASGRLNRGKLGQRVFANPAERKELEAIVHPAIRVEAQKRRTALAAQGHALAFYEAAVLLETGLEKDLDGVLLIAAEPATQLRRLRERGLSESEAQQRLAAQWSLEEKRRRSNWVVSSEQPLPAMRVELEKIWHTLQKGS